MSIASATELIGFGYTSRPGGRGDWLDVNFSVKAGALEYEVCRPKGGGMYDVEEFSCPALRKGKMALSGEEEKRLRALLLLAQPAKLSEDGPFLLPHGCSFVLHGSTVYSIVFSDGKKFGAFIVQQHIDCEGLSEARRYIDAIVEGLPDQSIVEEYPVYWQPEDRS